MGASIITSQLPCIQKAMAKKKMVPQKDRGGWEDLDLKLLC